jgi:hypothetical protein
MDEICIGVKEIFLFSVVTEKDKNYSQILHQRLLSLLSQAETLLDGTFCTSGIVICINTATVLCDSNLVKLIGLLCGTCRTII